MTNVLKKEPVLLGAALTVTVHGVCLLFGLDTAPTAVVDAIALGWVTWLQRILSVPVVKVDAAVDAATDAGRNAALADVSTLHRLQFNPEPPAPPTKKAPAKRAPAKKRAA